MTSGPAVMTQPRTLSRLAWIVRLTLLMGGVTLWAARVEPAAALEIHQNEIAIVEPNEIVDDDLLIVGGTVAMHGHVRGDVYAIGQTVRIGGIVDGDVIVLGDDVATGASIAGDLRVLARRLDLGGAVRRNASIVAANLFHLPGATIDGRLTAQSETAALAGLVIGGATVSASRVAIEGRIGGVARFATESFSVHSGAAIDRANVRTDGVPTIESGAHVPALTHEPPRRFVSVERLGTLWHAASRLVVDGALLASLIVAGLVGRVAPRVEERAFDALTARPVTSLAIGVAVVGIGCLAALGFTASIVGFLPGLTMAALTFLVLAAGWLIAAQGIGRMIDAAGRMSARLTPGWRGVGGAAVLWLIGQIPRVGAPLVAILTLVAIGTLWRSARPVHYRP